MSDNNFDNGDEPAWSPLNLPQTLSTNVISTLPPSAYYIPSFISPAEEASLLHHIASAPLPTWKKLSHRRLQAYPSVLSNSNTLVAAPLPSWLAEPILSRLLAISVHIPDQGNAVHPSEEGQHEAGQSSANAAPTHIFSNSPHGAPNHCLVNEYLPGQGIHPHEDGNAYWPVVCTVSLGSHTVLEISRKKSHDDGDHSSEVPTAEGEGVEPAKAWRILQERRSLLISTGEVYTECLHGMEGLMVDEGLGPESIANWEMLGDTDGFKGARSERGKRISLTFRDVLKVKALGKAFGGLMR